MIECSADEGHACDSGPDGDLCPSCQAEHDYWRRQYDAATAAEREAVLRPEAAEARYVEEMTDAGRAHLIRRDT